MSESASQQEHSNKSWTFLAGNRRWLQACADAVGWFLALQFATAARFEFDVSVWSQNKIALAWVIAAGVHAIFGILRGLYGGRWQFGSFEEVAGLATATVVAGAALFVVVVFTDPRLVPLSVTLVGSLMALGLMFTARYVWRLIIDNRRRPTAEGRTKVVVYGAGVAGTQVVDSMLADHDSQYVPVALLDDDPLKARLMVRRIPVGGTRDALADVVAQTGATRVVVAVPSASRELLSDLADRSAELGIAISVVPPVHELLDGNVGVADIRPLSEADLLGRSQVETDLSAIAGYLTGKTVLVTGAGGSIGSELCRQIHRFSPDVLVMLDRDESALHGVQLSIEGHALLDTRNLVVANIRDAERMFEVFEEHRPDVVFHAAALKHLPLLEMHPDEGVKTNVFGTHNVLMAASHVGVERFVNVSTDKAADPTSVLGVTKRIAERLTADVATQVSGQYLSIRFGNVLGSRGSVLETFRRQIANGGPVTVTSRTVTRYFMTVEEAVQLVIQAGAIGESGQVLVLDMGKPVLIADVARRLIAQAERPIEIVFTGLRPGEKADEVLFSDDESAVPSAHPLISTVSVPPLGIDKVQGRNAHALFDVS